MSDVTITCWQCEESMTLAQRGDEDGQCPHCGVEVDLEDYLIAAKAEAQAQVEELAQALRHLLHNIKASGKRIDLGLAKECAEAALARIDSTAPGKEVV
ncbi:hypothetical protein P3858_29685 [Pseudomonas aeruginosa]|nr:hypothetical protein [Pseudomonas aeruginosa]